MEDLSYDRKSDNALDIHHTIGNHDIYNIGKNRNSFADGKKWACEEFQISKPYYAFDKAGWRFIVLDSVHQRAIPGYVGMIDPEQMDWLGKTLADTPATTYVCIVSHIPILSMCALFDDGRQPKLHIRDANMITNAKELKTLFYQHKNVRACLSGHIHLIDQLDYLGVNYYCNGAVSGGWWGGNNQEFPPVYSVMNFYDDGSNDRELYYYGWKA